MHSIKRIFSSESGDTLVEVLLATVVLSIVLGGAYSASARSLRVNQTAVEKTEVVNKIREQVELIRDLSANGRGTPAWGEVEVYLSNPTPPSFYINFLVNPADPATAFYTPNDSEYIETYQPAAIPVKDTYGDNGVVDIFNIWIEPSATGSDYYEFKVRAAWDGIGSQGPQSAGAVLRVAQ